MRNSWKAVRGLANVVSVGVGFAKVQGYQTSIPALIVGVKQKVPTNRLKAKDVIPSTIYGARTDVVQVGTIKAQASFDPTKKCRPAPPGTSVGHPDITAGTFGCVVYDRDGYPLILSNNHVLANSNDAKIGDPIYQPGPHDGGTENDEIGILENFIPIEFSEGAPTCPIARGSAKVANLAAKVTGRAHRLKAVRESDAFNQVDAAVCRPINEHDIVCEIPKIGQPGDYTPARVGMNVHKYGRTTRYTTGVVEQTDAIVTIQYGGGKTATFENQIMTSPMSEGGDSGSLVMEKSEGNGMVGLLFAGSTATTVLNPIQVVLDKLGVS